MDINPDKVCFIIIKAREFDVKEDVVEEDYGGNAADEGFREVLADHADDPTGQELKDYIDGLNEDEQVELVALAWIGRGDFTAEEWDQAVSDARESREGPTSDYLIGMPILGDLLENGLSEMGHSCIDFDAGHL